VNATGPTLIILHFRYPQGKLIYSTRQKVLPKYWNNKKKRIKVSDAVPQASSINKILNKIDAEIIRIYNDLIYRDITPSNIILKEKLNELLKIDSTTIKIPQIHNKTFLQLFDLFIEETKQGIRLKKDGTVIKYNTYKSYLTLKVHLEKFTKLKKFPLKIIPIDSLPPNKHNEIKQYYKKFYQEFTDYLYNDCNNFDNGVGQKIKNLRVFFNYLINEKGFNLGSYFQVMYVPSEDIKIFTLNPDQLKLLICDPAINDKLCSRLQRIKDILNTAVLLCCPFLICYH
jgi:hypothetical protein